MTEMIYHKTLMILFQNLSSELGLGPSTLKEQILFDNFMELCSQF